MRKNSKNSLHSLEAVSYTHLDVYKRQVNGTSFNRKLSQTTTASALLESLKTYSTNSNLKRSIVVGVIGYPNVGKSSVINALLARRGGHSKACLLYTSRCV